MTQLDPVKARSLFPLCEKEIYMQHGGNGLISTRSIMEVDRVYKVFTSNFNWGEVYVGEWEALRSRLAKLVGADSQQIALTRGTAHGISVAARGLDWKPGDNIVIPRREFPTNLFPWLALKRLSVETRIVDPVDGRVTKESLFNEVDDRTRVVSISWVQYLNGYRANIEEIGAACKDVGIRFVVDAIQGLGVVGLDVRRSQIDILACGAGKWLLGPSGIGFVYVSPEMLQEVLPPLIGSNSLAINPELDFEDHDEFKPGAPRFEESAVSWADIAAFAAGLGILEEVGADVVEARSLSLARSIGDGLAAAGYTIVQPWPRSQEESSGIVSFRPGIAPAEAHKILRDGGIHARLGRDLIRFSTHFFNTEEEVGRVLDFVQAKISK